MHRQRRRYVFRLGGQHLCCRDFSGVLGKKEYLGKKG
jgi:hypothetical protein